MSLFVRYDVTKPGALERQLAGVFGQRFEDNTFKLWKKKKWLPKLEANAQVADATFALGDGRCQFTLPASLEDAEELRAFLTSKKAKNLELRAATPADVIENRLREVEIASRAKGEVISTSQSVPLGDSETPWEVSVLFPRDETAPPYELVAFDDELVGFNLHPRGPQLHVLASSFEPGSTIARTITNLPAPLASLNGLSRGPDGVLHAGGQFFLAGADYTTVHVSTDRGRTWTAEDCPGLSAILGGTGLATTCWFEDTLWVANEKGIARRVDRVWEAVTVPPQHVPENVTSFHRYYYQAGCLVVVDGTLFFLGKGIARWDGASFITELEPAESRFENTILSLVATNEGTLIAGGPVLWRKPRGATWQRTSNEALGIDPTKPKPGEGMWSGVAFPGLHLVGGHIVLVGNKHEPWEQRHLLRISDDDGKTYRTLPFERPDGALVTSSSVLDSRGGVVIAGFGGTVLRVAPPGS